MLLFLNISFFERNYRYIGPYGSLGPNSYLGAIGPQ